MAEPRWHDDHEAWKANIRQWDAIAGETGRRYMAMFPVTNRALEVATTVFYYAADCNTLYRAPMRMQIHAWARIFDSNETRDMEWLTPELATAAVHAHFAQCDDGHIMPADVLQQAALLRLEQEANNAS